MIELWHFLMSTTKGRVAPPIVLNAGSVTVVDVKTKKMEKQRKLGAEMLASNHEINRKIK